MGHGTCTCEGAAFEYAFNVDHELRQAGVRDMADVVYLTNENELGDFGVGRYDLHPARLPDHQRDVDRVALPRTRRRARSPGAHVAKVEPGVIHYETARRHHHTLPFDFAMLLPPFGGVPTSRRTTRPARTSPPRMFAPSGFMKVDADYTAKPYEEWRAADWPSTYSDPGLRQRVRRRHRLRPAAPDLPATQEPERHGDRPVPAAHRDAVGRHGQDRCADHRRPDQARCRRRRPTARRWPRWGRPAWPPPARAPARHGRGDDHVPGRPRLPDLPRAGGTVKDTYGEIGLAGHWVKPLLHYLFIYKAKARPGWFLIPE